MIEGCRWTNDSYLIFMIDFGVTRVKKVLRLTLMKGVRKRTNGSCEDGEDD